MPPGPLQTCATWHGGRVTHGGRSTTRQMTSGTVRGLLLSAKCSESRLPTLLRLPVMPHLPLSVALPIHHQWKWEVHCVPLADPPETACGVAAAPLCGATHPSPVAARPMEHTLVQISGCFACELCDVRIRQHHCNYICTDTSRRGFWGDSFGFRAIADLLMCSQSLSSQDCRTVFDDPGLTVSSGSSSRGLVMQHAQCQFAVHFEGGAFEMC